MKSFKGVFVKTLKIIPTINSWRKGFSFPSNPLQHTFHHQNRHSQPVYKEQDCKININLPEQVIDSKDQKGKETDLDIDVGPQDINKPSPKIEAKEAVIKEDHSRLPVSSNSNSNTVVKDETVPERVEEIATEEHPSLKDFEERCPPGGEDSVVLYTTSLRGIRKTFEDCRSIRYLLNIFKILIHERDVSMDMEFREELWRLFGERVVPPKLFIKGRYIGGADEVIGLHEEGKLRKLLKGIPSINIPCRNCANMRFLVCRNCDGGRKIFAETRYDDEQCLQCPDCNENGLVKCPVCS